LLIVTGEGEYIIEAPATLIELEGFLDDPDDP
jgi:hypothetical protein